MVILGSANSLIGPVLGAAFFLCLPRRAVGLHRALDAVLRAAARGARAAGAGRHLGHAAARDRRRRSSSPASPRSIFPKPGASAQARSRRVSEFLLEIEHLRKAFGALIATDDVTLASARGETHALIGPNGAGKTTLVGQLTGELTPDAGRIIFDGRDITGLSTAQRARLGLARSFQITSIFDSFTAEGNVALAVQATEPHSFRFWQPAERIARLRAAGAQAHRRRRPRPARPPHRGADVARPASPARARHGARHPAGDAAARRADGGSRHRGVARDVAAARERQGAIHHPPDRARHGRRVLARRPHLGSGRRPHHRVRNRRRDPDHPGVRVAYLGEEDDELQEISKAISGRHAQG